MAAQCAALRSRDAFIASVGVGLTRYSEEYWLQFDGNATSEGLATNALLGVGSAMFLVFKLARNTRGANQTRYGGVSAPSSGDTRALDVQTRDTGGPGSPTMVAFSTSGNQGATLVNDPAWGPLTLCTGYDGNGNRVFKVSSCHESVYSDTSAIAGTPVNDFENIFLGYVPAQTHAPMSFVSITALTVEPTAAELDAFSKKNVMVQDVWSASDVWTHYHCGSLRNAGASWVLDPWPDQQGPAVEMVLGSAVSDANLTAWTEPTIAWPTQPMAMMTGDYVAGAGIRWLESQTGRVFGTATGRGLLMKCTRDADGPGSSRHYSDAYETGATRTGFLRDAGGTFPAATILGDGQAAKGPTYSASVAGDMQTDVIDMIGTDCDSAGAYNVYAAGVKASSSAAAVAIVPAERITAGARADTATVGTDIANALMQEIVYTNRPLVGDEWLTLSSNLGVDPRLVLGMDGIDTDGALTHVYSLAYIDIATQKVPDLIDGAAAADSLDVQGTAVTAGQIIPINASGEPVFGSFGDGFDESFS